MYKILTREIRSTLERETMAVFGCRKTFSGKYIFSRNANFRKRKMFPCVWLHFKKFSGKYFLVFGKEEGKHKSRKKTPLSPARSRDQQRRRDLAINGDGAISRSTLREIAINGAGKITIDASRDRDRCFVRSRRRS